MKRKGLVLLAAVLLFSSSLLLIYGCGSSSSAATATVAVEIKSFGFTVHQKSSSAGVTYVFTADLPKDGDGYLIQNNLEYSPDGVYYYLPMGQELTFANGLACDMLIYSLLKTDAGYVFDGSNYQRIKLNIGSTPGNLELPKIDIKTCKNVINNIRLSPDFKKSNFQLSVNTMYMANYIVPPYADIQYCNGRMCSSASAVQRMSLSPHGSTDIEAKSEYWGINARTVLPDTLNSREIVSDGYFLQYNNY